MTAKTNEERKISDTVTVTRDGRTEVNIRELFKKKHITTMMEHMRSRIEHIPAATQEPTRHERPGSRANAE
jgi:predicted  nucleic acid-binding Zn-ribbon protein